MKKLLIGLMLLAACQTRTVVERPVNTTNVSVASGARPALDAFLAEHEAWVDEEALTATVEAGHNGRAFEALLNERGLSFPHYPASAEWASVGGYVADLIQNLGMLDPILGGVDR